MRLTRVGRRDLEQHLERLADDCRGRLADDTPALDVVEFAVHELESCGLYVAGRGSAPNSAGHVELDDVLFGELVEGHLHHPHRSLDDLGAGGDDGPGLLPAEHGRRDLRGRTRSRGLRGRGPRRARACGLPAAGAAGEPPRRTPSGVDPVGIVSRAGRALLLGEKTWGKGTVQKPYELRENGTVLVLPIRELKPQQYRIYHSDLIGPAGPSHTY